jgi:hypothetical protein
VNRDRSGNAPLSKERDGLVDVLKALARPTQETSEKLLKTVIGLLRLAEVDAEEIFRTTSNAEQRVKSGIA